ncbi:alpha/beta fold hydrolase [Flavobacterium sp. ACN6]|uniref:alpha/beta fold hydrolase n=1 Tax=Flavobacterium sp. ACN6 TaxID=1920426 RepID=UPI000BB300D5|nr:alpha/beta hydrolase [Flavobacterium sp. ACN6]PBJ10166.1 Haloalkane dehalogenase [Flavobacterium sp. ACN6]
MNLSSLQSEKVIHKMISIDSIKIAYREAGEIGNPVLILLHGFPSSSHMFRTIIPKLSRHFHIIAPDLPAFGFSDIPNPETFKYSFENYSNIVNHFLEELEIVKASFYLFDYGAPILMRVLIKRPEMIEMLIFQNGNIYNEGVGDVLKEISGLYSEINFESFIKLKRFFEFDYTKWEYLNGVQDIANISPETYFLDQFLMDREGVKAIQMELKSDYKTNVALYSVWQDFLKELQPVTLIVWGENDEVFKKEGAELLQRDLPDSKLLFYPTGHFALEEFGDDIAEEIIAFWYLNFKLL